MDQQILIVEDADSLRQVLGVVLESSGYQVQLASSAEEAIGKIRDKKFSCVLCDFKLPGLNGLDFLRTFRESCPTVPFVMMTAYGSIDIAVDAMRLGANDFICKPFEPNRLSDVISEVLEHRQILDREHGLKTKRQREFLSKSPSVERLLHDVKLVAQVDSSVLLLGESGTGKELVARFIHEQSPRRDKPFVAVNCGALPSEILESEFFGHEAGSFTGATQTRVGVFEYASEGTIFLDEIGDMPPALQVKLLRVLQEHELRRVGSTRVIKVNPRVIAATNCDIRASIEQKRLREDLYYRLAVITFQIPPLRDRLEDIEYLANYYINYFSHAMAKPGIHLGQAASRILRLHRWPGNARELENVIERAVILADGEIGPEHLGFGEGPLVAPVEGSVSLIEISSEAARRAEVELISRTLIQTGGNKSKAAQWLGVSYKTLLNKVREYGLDSSGDDETKCGPGTI